MKSYPGSLRSNGGARSGIAPMSLLDLQTVDNYFYYFSDRAVVGIQAALSLDNVPMEAPYTPWLLSAPTFTFYRSLQTDVGSFTLQNTGGDTLAPEWERISRRDALEGALFVFRYWSAAAGAAWLEVHGTISVKSTQRPTAELTGYQLLRGEDDTPAGTYSETCQLVWAEKRCGATGPVECLYSYKTCQVTDRFTGVLVNFEQNFTETIAATPTQVINRRRSL